MRAKSYLHLWRLQFPTGGMLIYCSTALDTHLHPLSLSAGIIRSLACAENWIAVGNYNGVINTLDFRTGELLGNWRPSEFSPMQVSNECSCIYIACIVTYWCLF